MSVVAAALEFHSAIPNPPPVSHGAALAQQTEVSTTGLRQWINDNAFVLIILLIACAIGLAANKGNVSAVVTKGGLSLVAILFFALAGSTGALSGLGAFLLSLIGIQV
ncbi:hypothetical protein [Nocardia salmonicida]|uniref:hypothetical protein n=1 Tax=Nocardia salmonicida TaxID=53431 RepID=UPI0007C6CE6E|nr:hypothetical protein [Nocardia salmonicida]MBC7299807.1 hypothetical protein [Nocardia sp.]